MEITTFEVVGTDSGIEPSALPAEGWVPAIVPGGVHESLLAAGRIEHPYQDRNEEVVRWIEERDWWFRASFGGPAALAAGERARLVFHGLDTVVDLWLNGERIGHHENMFRPAVFDVTDRLRGVNELLLRFSPPLAGLTIPDSVRRMGERMRDMVAQFTGEAADGSGESGLPEALPLSTLRRKATMSWGWDFAPRVPSIGIWRPVELLVEKRAVITGHHVRTDKIGEDGSATVSVLVEVDHFATDAPLAARVSLTSPSGRTTTLELPIEDGNGHAVVTVPDAELWWTHDLGSPTVYDVSIGLMAGEDTVDRLSDRVGLRTIAIDRSPDDEGGRLFRFVLNGTPLFARGAAWLPADMLVGSVSAGRHRALVGLARDGGMNMLRIWGGGIYETDSFYKACDELGVLIWHDFMFACTDYPSDDPILAGEVAKEAEYQVKRLRNRASMALWSGNNEVQLLHGFAYQNYEPGDWGYDFFYRLLPDAVAAFDGGTPYWPGSPWGEDPTEGFMTVNGVLDGDRHAWEVWHGFDMGAGGGSFENAGEARDYRRYANDRGKFISEFGIHASPELSTLRACIPDAELYVHSASFDHHNKDNPKNKHDAVLEIVTGLPESVEQYVDFTMVSQAEGLKFGIEHYRRRQPHCSGTLVWQFNDVWPGFSWSVVDHQLVPKAGYHYVSRAFAPVVAGYRKDGDTLELWVTTSGRQAVSTTATVTLASFGGETVLREDVPVMVAPGESRRVWAREALPLTADRFAWVESSDGAFPPNRLFFAEIRDIPWPPSTLAVTAKTGGPGAARLTITASGFAYFVHVLTPAPGVRFGDNYVDLRDGDTVTIDVTGLPEGFDPVALDVRGYIGAGVSSARGPL